MLYQNLLPPFMALPGSEPNLLDTNIPTESTQPLPVDITTSVNNTDQDDLAVTSVVPEVSSADTGDTGTQAATPPAKYAIPQKRPGYILDLTIQPFVLRIPDSTRGGRPRVLPSRSRQRPHWQTSGNWVT